MFRVVFKMFEAMKAAPPRDAPDHGTVSSLVDVAWTSGDAWLRACAVRAARHAPDFDPDRFTGAGRDHPLVRAELCRARRRAEGGDVLTAVERVLILKSADLLNDVGPRHLLRLAEVAREVAMWKGNTIYKEDDLADGLYMVVEGRVRLTTGDQTTSEVGPGEAFGTWALVDDTERGHRVECIEDGLALMLPRDEFYDVAAGDLALLQEVVRALARRLRTLVSERPEEARIEGEGVEKPEALDEEKTNPLALETPGSSTPAGAPAPTPGESLKAAALGQGRPEGDVAAPDEPPAVVSGEIATPEPIVPVEPSKK
jgi:hypothetical protein